MPSSADTVAVTQPSARMAPSPDPSPASPAADEARDAPRRGVLAAGRAKLAENIIPALTVAVVAGLVLFGLDQINGRITDTNDRIAETNDRITRLEQSIDARFADINDRIAETNDRITRLEQRIEARFVRLEESIDARFAETNDRITRLEESIESRFVRLEENQQAMALTLARLVALIEGRGEAPDIASD